MNFTHLLSCDTIVDLELFHYIQSKVGPFASYVSTVISVFLFASSKFLGNLLVTSSIQGQVT